MEKIDFSEDELQDPALLRSQLAWKTAELKTYKALYKKWRAVAISVLTIFAYILASVITTLVVLG